MQNNINSKLSNNPDLLIRKIVTLNNNTTILTSTDTSIDFYLGKKMFQGNTCTKHFLSDFINLFDPEEVEGVIVNGKDKYSWSQLKDVVYY